MAVVALGLLGFIGGICFDVAPRLGWPRLRRPMAIAAGGLLLWAHLLVVLEGEGITTADWSLWLGAPVMGVAIALLVYSLTIEIPFRGTYLGTGPSPLLFRHGTYALVRHPGVLWYGLFLAGLGLVAPSPLLAIAAPLWLLADIVWVAVEELWTLPRVFPEYSDYRRETPMLVPTLRSLRACLNTLRRART